MGIRRGKKAGTSVQTLLLTVGTVIITLGLISCADVTPPGYVEKQWSTAIRELGVTPVYPPEEDVQVGDIYLLPESPAALDAELNKTGFVPYSQAACVCRMNQDISDFYAQRSSFPFTSTNVPSTVMSMTNNPFGLISQDRAAKSIFVDNGDNQRLRLVGFPQFMSASFTEGDLSALIPIEAVSVGLGASFSARKTVVVSVPVAETYGVPTSYIQPYFASQSTADFVTSSKEPNDGHFWRNRFNGTSQSSRYTNAAGVQFVYGVAIYRVFYTRAIDVSIQVEQGGAGTVRASVTGSQLTNLMTQVTQTSTNASGAVTTTTTTLPAIGDPVATANALNAINSANLSSQLTPGGKLNYVSVSDGAVSMRRTYSSPIAIGLRGIEFTLDQNGNISQKGEYNSVLPPTLEMR